MANCIAFNTPPLRPFEVVKIFTKMFIRLIVEVKRLDILVFEPLAFSAPLSVIKSVKSVIKAAVVNGLLRYLRLRVIGRVIRPVAKCELLDNTPQGGIWVRSSSSFPKHVCPV